MATGLPKRLNNILELNNVLVYDMFGTYFVEYAMNELTPDEHGMLVDAIHDSATVIHKGQRMNEQVKAMWADPRFQLLADLDRVFGSNKVWGGMEWVYYPILPEKYRPMAERIRAELRNLYTEYGVEE